MSSEVPESLGLIAGRGAYPRVFAESARKQGVQRLFAVAFRKETSRDIEQFVDDVRWLRVGQLQPFLEAFAESGVRQAVMVGQISPTSLFRVRPDKQMFQLLAGLNERNAHTIFGAVGDELKKVGVELAPASTFMESTMPEPGHIAGPELSDVQQEDLALGLRVAKKTSGLDIGQTVVVKEGTILAVEAFEGTDKTILRAGKLGGPGSVVVKVAKRGHDMRFDIPVVGERTLKKLHKARASVLAVEARRTILLEREKLSAMAAVQGLSLVAVEVQDDG